MSFLSGLVRERRFAKGATIHPSNPAPWLKGDDSFSGVSVDENSSLGSMAVFAAVRVLSESVAQLPLKLYQRRGDGGKDLADGEREYFLMHDQPNPETTSFRFRETSQSHLLTWGNSYAEIDLDNAGRTQGIWQRRPDRVEVVRRKADNELMYKFRRDGGGEDVLDSSQVLHVPGLSFNGLVGLSPIRVAREAIGLGIGLERYGAALFGNGTVPGLVVKVPNQLSPEGTERLRTEIERVHKGPKRAGRVMVLDEGMEPHQLGLPNDDAEFLATRTFQIQEVARLFNVPPHLLRDLSKSSFNNIEEQDREFLKISLLPWLKRWEAELNRKVLTTSQRQAGMFFEFVLDGMLRANFADRMEGHRVAVNGSWMTPNEVRKKENMNPVDALDFYLVPQNMAILKPDGTLVAPVPPQQERLLRTSQSTGEMLSETTVSWEKSTEGRETREKRSLDARWRLQDTFRPLIEEAARRTVIAEVKAVRREVKRIGERTQRDFFDWLAVFYREQHSTFVASVIGPVLRSYLGAVSQEVMIEREQETDDDDFARQLEQFSVGYEEAMAVRQTAKSRRELMRVAERQETEEDAQAAIMVRLDEWLEKKAAVMANAESTQAGGAVSVMAYLFAGVATLRWAWNGGKCPLCSKMDGRTVQTGRPFLSPGQSVGDPEEVTPFEVKRVHSHPPLHGGCKCTVAPA